MIKAKFNSVKIKSDLKKLKSILIILSILQGCYLLIFSLNIPLSAYLDNNYKLDLFVKGFNILTRILFIWYIWKCYPITKKKRSNNTWMIIFLGIIGMWLWMPSKNEVNKLVN